MAPEGLTISAPTPATAQLSPEYGLRQPRYQQMGMGRVAFRRSRLGPSVLSASTGPIHGLSPADRPLTSRLLMVVVWVLSCHGAWASPGIAMKRPSSAPCRFLEFANSRLLRVPSATCGPLSFAGPLGIPHLVLDSSRGVVGGSLQGRGGATILVFRPAPLGW